MYDLDGDMGRLLCHSGLQDDTALGSLGVAVMRARGYSLSSPAVLSILPFVLSVFVFELR